MCRRVIFRLMRKGILMVLLCAVVAAQGTAEQASKRVLSAFQSKDRDALVAIAATNHPDPWLVADELCAAGKHDAAEAFAKAASRPDLTALPAYVKSRRAAGDQAEVRDALARIAALGPKEVLAVLEPLQGKGDDVASIRVSLEIGRAYAKLRQVSKAISIYLRTAKRAGGIGWLFMAQRANWYAFNNAAVAGNLRGAATLGKRLVALAKKRGSPADEARTLVYLGWFQRHLGQRPQGRAAIERARMLYGKLRPEGRAIAGTDATEIKGTRALSSVYLAMFLWDDHRDEAGRKLSREGIAVLEQLGRTTEAIRGRTLLGEHLNAHHEYAAAVFEFTRALNGFQAQGVSQGVAYVAGHLGWAQSQLGNYDEALRAYGLVRDISLRSNATFYLAWATMRLGHVRELRSEYEQALANAKQALEMFRKLKNTEHEAYALTNQAVAKWRMHRYDDALASLEEARKLHVKRKDANSLGGVYTNLGLVHQSLGDLRNAAKYYAQALEVAEASKDPAGVAQALNNSGMLSNEAGAQATALRYYERALDLARKAQLRGLEATLLGNIAEVGVAVGQFDRGLRLHRQALAIKEAIGDRRGAAVTRTNMGRTLELMGRFDQAREVLVKALGEHRRLKDLTGEASALMRMAIVDNQLRDFEEAAKGFRAALDIFRRLGVESSAAWAEHNLADVALDRGEAGKAITGFEQSLAMGQRLGEPLMQVRSFEGLAGAQIALGKNAKAVAAARSAVELIPGLVGDLADEESASARARFAEIYDYGVQAAVRLDDPATLFYFIESGRAGSLLESLKSRQRLRNVALPPALAVAELEARKRELEARAAYQRARRAGEDLAPHRAKVDEAQRELAGAVARIQREAKAQTDLIYPKAISLEECRGTLRPGEAMVLYALLPDEAFALVVEPKAARIVKLGPTSRLEESIRASFERAVTRPNVRGVGRPEKSLTYLSERLRKLVIKPLGLGSQVTRVLISPDGWLAYVPFCALWDRELAYLPSATTYQALSAERSKRGVKVLALGDPDYSGVETPKPDALIQRGGGDLQPLPGSGKEAKAVGDVLLLSDKATVDGLRQALLGAKRWRAVHLACHGHVDPERPVLSSLMLTPGKEDDGTLRCLDVFRMRIPADLAVLSACETGKGRVYRAEGVVGFTRAFLFAGCPRVIVSVWRVDDDATRALMVKFYELWNPKDGSQGLAAATALRKAQEHVRSREKWKHPYFWAAWQLWGLPD